MFSLNLCKFEMNLFERRDKGIGFEQLPTSKGGVSKAKHYSNPLMLAFYLS
jgi:hypothetical protein